MAEEHRCQGSIRADLELSSREVHTSLGAAHAAISGILFPIVG